MRAVIISMILFLSVFCSKAQEYESSDYSEDYYYFGVACTLAE